MGLRAMRAKMKAVAEELVKLNGDTSIVTPQQLWRRRHAGESGR